MGILLGSISVIIAVISYSLYFRDIFLLRTRPHGFTWLVWACLNALIFYQQSVSGGGAGAWVTGVAAIANALIFTLSFKFGERFITRLDYICLLLALFVLVIGFLGVSPAFLVVLASTAFVLGFIPTFRKSLRNSHQETKITYGLNSLKFLIALFALDSFTVVTALYPFVLFLINALFAILLFYLQTFTNHKKPKDTHVHTSKK